MPLPLASIMPAAGTSWAASASSTAAPAAAAGSTADPAPGGAAGGGAFAAQVKEETMGEKIKKELIKTLKLQLVLVPVCFLGMLWMYPPVSKSEEKKLQELYEKSAGWKT
jgi:hypothetical protein